MEILLLHTQILPTRERIKVNNRFGDAKPVLDA